MALHSSDYGNLAGAFTSIYSPQAGSTIASLFGNKSQPAPAPSAAIAAPQPPAAKVPAYVWIGGGLLGSVLVVFILVRMTR